MSDYEEEESFKQAVPYESQDSSDDETPEKATRTRNEHQWVKERTFASRNEAKNWIKEATYLTSYIIILYN